jgi:DNA-binding NarL/FixJ family response regulator
MRGTLVTRRFDARAGKSDGSHPASQGQARRDVTITTVIIDQERTFCDALARLLNAEKDFMVVSVAQPTAMNLRWHADVILLDGDFADSDQLCRAASRPPNTARVIMLSSSSEPSRIIAAIEAGARAWVRKDSSIEFLLGVLRGVARGETWLPPAETGNVLSLLLKQRDRERLLACLTPRERQVVTSLGEGASRNQIAEQLNLTANTVRTHVQNIMAKLDVHSTVELVALTRAWSLPPG